jgi:polysaccharide pyruvyl transferase WcaK-like protein
MSLKSKQPRGSTRIALLTPYDGGNLGDCAIQEALIENLRRYSPDIDMWGITLHPTRTSARHQIPCFPLTAISRSYYRGTQERVIKVDNERRSVVAYASEGLYRCMRRIARAVPFVKWVKILVGEALHMCRSYRLLQKVDALVIAGGGQLDDEWGGSWGHPYALMKWAVLARAAGSSVAFLSVGACRIDSQLTRRFLKTALTAARYRSYRDAESRLLALGITPRAEGQVVPDLAFSLPITKRKADFREEGAPLRIGVSPIAYCHPELWPTKNQIQYKQYITELAIFVSKVLQGGESVCLFSSSSPDDRLFTDLYHRLDPALDPAARNRLSSIVVNTLRELLEVLFSVDLVVASRLHGLLLSFLSGKPALAISYDRKVNRLMDELGQAAYCVEIGSLKSDDLLTLLSMLRTNRDAVVPAVAGICRKYDWILQQQYSEIMQFLAGRSADPLPLHPQALSETRY